MTELESLMDQHRKLSYLFGVMTGGLLGIASDERPLPEYHKQKLQELLNTLYKGLDGLFYPGIGEEA